MAILSAKELSSLLVVALKASGFSGENAESLANQTILAEQMGQANVGVAHLFDYIDGPAQGRINGMAKPDVSYPAPTMIHVDGNGGLPQTGFDQVFEEIVAVTQKLGVCLFLHKNATLCGSLGSFLLPLADRGLVCFAATNGTPFLAGSGSTRPVFCTNPIAFASPQAEGPPLLIDQSSSAAAYVDIRSAAERGESIPPGWALDNKGQPTTDPRQAMQGALLSFGGSRGANIALMVEILAGGLTSANWSLDAAPFSEGDTCPGTGLFLFAIDPVLADTRFFSRMKRYLHRLSHEYGVYIPGLSKASAQRRSEKGGIDIEDRFIARLKDISSQHN